MDLVVGDYVQIVLHKGYSLDTPGARRQKLGMQTTGPFKINEKIRRGFLTITISDASFESMYSQDSGCFGLE